MDIELFKITAILTIFTMGIAGSLLATRLSAGPRSELLFSLGNAFAGGVFLGAGLIHMLPDAQAGFAALDPDSDYPWFAVLCIAGFLAVLWLERVLFRQGHQDGSQFSAGSASRGVLFPYLLMLTLSIHSVITGIALGTEARITQAFVILLAVLAHKGTAAFALRTSLHRAGVPSSRATGLMVLFAATTPIGILLGWSFMSLVSGQSARIFEAVFDALAAGTFLYIAVWDILQEEFAHRKSNGLKFVFVLAGFGVMAIVAIWT